MFTSGRERIRMRCTGIKTSYKGITLIEMVVAMLVFSAIAGVASQAFLTIMKISRETKDRSEVYRRVDFAIAELRRDAANVVPGKVGGFAPYEEGVDPETGARIYRILTRVPEGYHFTEQAKGRAQAILVEYSLTQEDEVRLRLNRTKWMVGASGPIGEPLKGMLVSNLSAFSLNPTFAVSEGEEGAGDGVKVPRLLQVCLDFRMPDGEVLSFSSSLLAHAEPAK